MYNLPLQTKGDRWDVYGLSWPIFDKEGMTTGQSSAHIGLWDAGPARTLCGIELSPTTGPRRGWDGVHYEPAEASADYCSKCASALKVYERNEEEYDKLSDTINLYREMGRDSWKDALPDDLYASIRTACLREVYPKTTFGGRVFQEVKSRFLDAQIGRISREMERLEDRYQ